jgi:hypothetical protein
MSIRRPEIEARARSVIDYALVRRTTLGDLAAGRVSQTDVCDAQHYLLRAARYHGETVAEPCPVCAADSVIQVSYTYGECFRDGVNGRAHPPRELTGMAGEYPEFTVYLVEVCPSCRWNHLLAAYVLGTGEPAKRQARS